MILLTSFAKPCSLDAWFPVHLLLGKCSGGVDMCWLESTTCYMVACICVRVFGLCNMLYVCLHLCESIWTAQPVVFRLHGMFCS
jgi:hypothetical protein